MARKKFRTPPTLPEADQCRGTVIPSSKEWLGIFSDALLETTKSYNYDQVNPTDLTPEETAELAYTVYTNWLASTCAGGDCPPLQTPGTNRIWRRNPATGLYEYVDDSGLWTPPDGIVEQPLAAPAPREEPTEQDKKCLAAANAADAVYTLWQTLLGMYETSVEPALQWGTFATDVGLTLGSTFYPPMAAASELVGAGLTLITAAFELITIDQWSAEFLREFKCVLKSNATVEEDGTVTFAHRAIIWNMNLKSWANLDYMIATMQLQYILETIGEEGLNRAGGLTNITEDDCTCGAWTRRWSFSQMHNGSEFARVFGTIAIDGSIAPTGTWPGRWAACQATITPYADTIFQRARIRYTYPASSSGQIRITEGSTGWLHSGLPDDAPYPPSSEVWGYGGPYTYHADLFDSWDFEKTPTGATLITIAFRYQGSAGYLKEFEISGTGGCPFSTGTIV